MDQPAIRQDDKAVQGNVHSGIRSYVTTDAEFRAAAEAGIASYDAGETFELDGVVAEIRRSILNAP